MSEREEGELESGEEEGFLAQPPPAYSPSRPTFFPQQQAVRSTFAPPPYRPSNAAMQNSIFNFSQPHPTFPRENAESFAARQSVDMDISPIESPFLTGICMFVDEPLEEESDTLPPATVAPAAPGPLSASHIIVAVVEPPIHNIIETVGIPQDVTTQTQAEKRPLPESVAAKIPIIAPRIEVPVPTKTLPPKLQKKFSQDFLRHIEHVLLKNISDESSSSSSSEFEEESKEIGELRRKLNHHNKEMHDELGKREKLVKEMESCQLMINHHYERMNAILRDMAEVSRQSVRHHRKSLSRTRSEGRRRRRKLCNNFGSRVTRILDELSAMNEEVKTPASLQVVSNTDEKLDESSELADVLENLIEDSGVEFVHSMNESSSLTPETPKRHGKHRVVDKAFEKDYLRRMIKARYGIKPLPHVVVPATKMPCRKKNSNASVDVNLEREEALRQKLLEQMKKKVQPSHHEKNKDKDSKKNLSKKPIQKLNDAVVVEKIVMEKVVNPSTPVVRTVKTVADVSTVPVASGETPKIVPTMDDIRELKKELKIALSKRRKGSNRQTPNSSLSATLNTTTSSAKNSSAIQNANIITSVPSAVKVMTVLPKPTEKENVGHVVVNPLKRSAPAESIHPSKKARPLPEERSKLLGEFEKRDYALLFDSPRTAVRNFVLSPEYPIKESIERLRHRNDPDVDLCYFELFGTCLDEECPYQHQRDFTLNDQQIVEEILSYIPQRKSRSESIQKQAKKLLGSNSIEAVIEGLRKETSHLDLIELAIENSV